MKRPDPTGGAAGGPGTGGTVSGGAATSGGASSGGTGGGSATGGSTGTGGIVGAAGSGGAETGGSGGTGGTVTTGGTGGTVTTGGTGGTVTTGGTGGTVTTGGTGGTGGIVATGGTGGATQLPCNGAGEIKDTSTGACYIFVNTSVNWDQARAACQLWGGELLAINSASEQAFIDANVRGNANSGWIGAFNDNNNSSSPTWQWSDGSSTSYSHWDSGEPNSAGENCGEMWSNWKNPSGLRGYWNDSTCSGTKPYYCEG